MEYASYLVIAVAVLVAVWIWRINVGRRKAIEKMEARREEMRRENELLAESVRSNIERGTRISRVRPYPAPAPRQTPRATTSTTSPSSAPESTWFSRPAASSYDDEPLRSWGNSGSSSHHSFSGSGGSFDGGGASGDWSSSSDSSSCGSSSDSSSSSDSGSSSCSSD